jgi:multidrug resistance efflux pump
MDKVDINLSEPEKNVSFEKDSPHLENTQNLRDSVPMPKEFPIIELRSEEVQDIISKVPNRLIRYGSLSVFIVIVLVIASSNFITYPDILPAEITITTTSPPVKIVTESWGKIAAILIKNNEEVDKGDVIAIIENPTNYPDVIRLKEILEKHSDLDNNLLSGLALGEITSSSLQYFDSRNRLTLFLNLNLYEKQKKGIIEQISATKALKKDQLDQQELTVNNVFLTQRDFQRNKKLFEEGVIATQQYEIIEKELLSAKKELSSIKGQINSTEISIASLQKNVSELELKALEEQTRLEQAVEQASKALHSAILDWEKKYLLTSSIDGMVTYLDHWAVGQYVKQGEVLFWVDPKFSNLIGKVKLPLHKSSKVKVGQKVQIKLDNYPFEEYGILMGQVKAISSLPSDKFYLIDVEFPEGLKSSYQIKLDFHQQMQGVASIVTEDLSLFDRIFYQFRKLINSR